MADGEVDFDAFVQTASRRLLRAAWVLTGDWHAAEDLVQGALEKCWPRWESLAADGNRLAYVRRVMTTSYLRGARRRWGGEVATEAVPDLQVEAGFDDALLSATLRAATRRLPPRQRACVALRYFLDLSEAETASAMGCSLGTVKSNTARALDALRANPSLVGLLEPRHAGTNEPEPRPGVVSRDRNKEAL